MKKQIMCLSLAAYCGVAFAQTDYKVTFTTDRTDITTIYLCSEEDGTVLDSASCHNGKAVMDGQTRLPQIAVVAQNKKSKSPISSFILDSTPTTINQTKTGIEVKGSPLNQKYAEVKKSVNVHNEKMRALQEEAKAIAQKNNGKIPDEQLKRLQDEFDKALHSQTEAIRTALQENKDNLIPASMIAFYSENIGMDKVEEYLKEYAYKDNGILKNVNNYIQALKRKAVGAMFTDFTMNDMQGTPRKLSDYVGKGNYVLVDFWASWCGPCRAEMPNVKKAYEQFHPKGFEIVGISFDAQKDAWQKATTQLGITWPQMSDLKAWNCEAGAIYGIRSIPATILFGPDGKIVATDLRGEELQKKLEKFFGAARIIVEGAVEHTYILDTVAVNDLQSVAYAFDGQCAHRFFSSAYAKGASIEATCGLQLDKRFAPIKETAFFGRNEAGKVQYAG